MPLTSLKLLLGLIRETVTKAGLRVSAVLSRKIYRKGRKVNDKEMSNLRLLHHEICPLWNYTISPRVAGQS